MIVIIVGAGIAGLACSIALAQHRNIEVTIFERATELVESGYGIQLPCNATNALRSLDLLEAVIERAGDPAIAALFMDHGNYTPSLTRDLKACKSLYGSPWLLSHHADFIRVLYDEALSRGVQVKFGCDVASVDFDALQVELGSGEIHGADVIVGSDGIHSTIRSGLHSTHRPSCTGLYARRAILNKAQLTSRNLTRLLNPGVCFFWLGPTTQISFCPLRAGDEFDLVVVSSVPKSNDSVDGAGLRDQLREDVHGWDPAVRELLDAVEIVSSLPLLELADLPSWGKDSVVMIGDAIHPTLPHLGQGAAMCLEDGLILGTLLGGFADHPILGQPHALSAIIPRVLRSFEEMRRGRTTNIISQSRVASTYSRVPRSIVHGTASMASRVLGERICSSAWPPANSVWDEELHGYIAEDVAKSALSRLAGHFLHEIEHGAHHIVEFARTSRWTGSRGGTS
ncbi:Monooxygenase, FAD-binding protein, partial [Metarhizium majus ARSEF 297]